MYNELDNAVRQDDSITMLRQQVHEFAKNEMRPASLELDKMDPRETVEKGSPYFRVFKQMKKMGLHKMYTPVEYGGLGFSAKQIHVVVEELGWGSVGLGAGLGVDAILPSIAGIFNDSTGGSLEEWADMIARPWMEDDEGKFIGCVPFTEPEHGSDIVISPHLSDEAVMSLGLRAPVKITKESDGWLVNGAKAAWPTQGPIATHCFASLNMAPHESIANQCFAFIPLDLPGVIKGPPIDKMGMRDVPQGEIVFDNVKIPLDNAVMIQGIWKAVASPMLALMGSGTGVVFVGLARAAFEEALQYSKERIQGGKLLIKHDTILMRLANMFQKVETARAFSRNVLDYALGQMLDERNFDFPATDCHTCKVFCTQQAYEVASEALQMFGTYGLIKEYLIEKFFRDARVGLLAEGCNYVETLITGHDLSEQYSLD